MNGDRTGGVTRQRTGVGDPEIVRRQSRLLANRRRLLQRRRPSRRYLEDRTLGADRSYPHGRLCRQRTSGGSVLEKVSSEKRTRRDPDRDRHRSVRKTSSEPGE